MKHFLLDKVLTPPLRHGLDAASLILFFFLISFETCCLSEANLVKVSVCESCSVPRYVAKRNSLPFGIIFSKQKMSQSR